MAAGAYKGLTIRIGADTSTLSKALSGANSAIYKTQGELRKLAQAAKLDPGNQNVLNAQLGAVGSQAAAVAQKMATLKKSIADSGEAKSLSDDTKTISELAKNTDNAALAAANAKSRWQGLTESLAEVYGKIKDLTGTDLHAAMNESPEQFKQEFREIKEVFSEGEYAEAFAQKVGMSVSQAEVYISRLQQDWNTANNAFEDAKMVESLHNAQTEFTASEAKAKSLATQMAELNSKSKFSQSEGIGQLDSKLALVSAAADTATDRFRRLDQAAKLNPMSIGAAVERAKALAVATDTAKQKAALLKEKLEHYKSNGIAEQAKHIGNMAVHLETTKAKYIEQETAVKKLEAAFKSAKDQEQALVRDNVGGKNNEEIRKVIQNLNNLDGELKKTKSERDEALKEWDTAKACSECDQLETEIREVTAEMKSLKQGNFGEVGTAAVQAAQQIGQYAQQIGRKVIDSANEVDASYRNLRKTFNAEEEDYQKLYDAAMKYSQSHVTSASSMLEMEAIAAQLGVGLDGGADAIQKFADTAANLDVATDIDADTIALQMGQIMNVMKDVSTDNIDKFGDALVRLGNNTATQESNIMQITQRLSAVGDVAGFSTPELMGLAASIASTGQRSEAAATGVSNTITTIQKAVGAGGDDLKAFADVAGKSADDFAKSWKESPVDALQDFLKGLSGLDDKQFNKLEELGITGVRQTQTLTALAKTAESVSRNVEMADAAFKGMRYGADDAGDAAREASKKAEGFSGTLSKLKNSADVLAASFGDAMVPFMKTATEWIQNLTSKLDSMGEGFKSTTVLTGALFAGFAVLEPPLAAIIGHLVKLGGGVLSGVTGLFGRASLEVGKFKEAIELAKGGAGTMGESLEATGTLVGRFTSKIKSILPAAEGAAAGASAEMATIGGAAEEAATGVAAVGTAAEGAAVGVSALAGFFGAIGIATAVDYIRQFIESAAEAKRSDDIIANIRSNVEGLSTALTTGKDVAIDYGKAWSDVAYDVNEFFAKMEEHNRINAETRDEAVTTIGELEHYSQVIDDAAGKGDKFAGSQLELKTAVEGLNEILGTNYSVADVLSGVYTDQDGKVQSLTKSVDELVAAKEREIRLSAMEDIYKEDLKAYMEAENAYKKAEDAREQYMNKRLAEKKAAGQDVVTDTSGTHYLTDEQLKSLIRGEEGYRDLEQAAAETNKTMMATGEALEITKNQYEGFANESAFLESSAFGRREGIMMSTEEVADALMKATFSAADLDAALEKAGGRTELLQRMQPQVKVLSQAFQDAKVGVSDFANLVQNNPGVFTKMVDDAGSDMEKLVGYVMEWNDQQLDEKYGEVHIDGNQLVNEFGVVKAIWDSEANEWKPIEARVDMEEAQAAADRLKALFDGAGNDVQGALDGKLSELSSSLMNVGVSADMMKNTSQEKFNELAASAGGDIDTLVAKLADLHGIHIDDKTFKVSAEQEISREEIDATASQLVEQAQTTVDSNPVKIGVEAKAEGFGEQDLVSKLQDISNTKYATTIDVTANTEGADEVIEVLGNMPEQKDVMLNVKESGVAQAAKNVGNLTNAADKMGSKDATYTAKGNAISSGPNNNVKKLNDAGAAMKNASAEYTAKGNAASGEAGANLWNLLRAINSMHSKSITLTTDKVTYERTVKKATGTYIDPNHMPKHAAGIFTRPTLTNIGWVGEDGAELYSGNSLVPLTNRKYSMPYINDISDAVAKKLDGGRGDNIITLYVTCEGDADENARAITRALEGLDL